MQTENHLVARDTDAYHLSWEQEQLLKRMTLQVCLIGKHGFVMASDEQGARIANGEVTQRYSTGKVFFNESECAVWCSAGHDLARRFCEELERILAAPLSGTTQRSAMQISECLREAASRVQASSSINEQKVGWGRVLLAFAREGEVVARCLQLGWIQAPQKWDISNSIPFRDKMSIGAEGNAALFIFQRYYSPDSSDLELIRMAAHTVLMGHRIDPGAVDGLEIVVCRNGLLRRLGEAELEELRKFSTDLDRYTQDQFRNT